MMRDKILVITDNVQGQWWRGIRKKSGLYDIYILTLGFTPEYFTNFSPYGNEISKICHFVEVDEFSDHVQRDVGSFYVNFIFELPRKVKPGLFFRKDKNLWWFLEVNERCSYRSRIINRLFFLGLIAESAGRTQFSEICLYLDDRIVAESILQWKKFKVVDLSKNYISKLRASFSDSVFCFLSRYIANCVGVFLLFLSRSLALKVAGIKGSRPEAGRGVYFFTNFPFWWNRPYGKSPDEKFFGTFVESTMREYPAFYAAWLFSLKPLAIFLNRSALNRFFEKHRMLLLDTLLNLREKSLVLMPGYFIWALSVFRYFRSFKSSYKDFDISGLVRYEIARSLAHVEFFDDILMETAVRNFAVRYSPRALVYRIEFQPFEKAILSGISGRCAAVGFQHSTYSRNRISHYFAPDEFRFHLAEGNASYGMPLPDTILSTGHYFRDIVVAAGFPKDKILLCGPLRYAGLVRYIKARNDKYEIRHRLGFADADRIFLVAFNWVKEEVMPLVHSIVEALKDEPAPVRMIFRSHPNKRYDREIRSFLKAAKPNFKYIFLEDEFSIYDGICLSDAVMQVPTTLGYEAIAIGRMPITYENTHIFSLNSTEELEACSFVVRSPGELKAAMRSVLSEDERFCGKKSAWPATLAKFFYDMEGTPGERFSGLLKDLGVFR